MRLSVLLWINLIIMSTITSCGQENSGKEFPYTNALIHSSSPYLQEHAHNPVDWYPWDKKALQKAKDENKPLIISIGYSACHWCHVMEHESYSDTAVANYMNEHFVSIKVDREERPDIDQIYMSASQLLTGSGGWPLNAFALPDGRPFYAVTYLPKDRWLNLLHQLVKLYQEEPAKVKEQAEALTKGIQGTPLIKQTHDLAKEKLKSVYGQLFDEVKKSIDFKEGGFGRAPKFPLPSGWELLLQYHYLTGNKEALQSIEITLDHMAMGGIYDQLGGGFARYATDKYWRVPHFEKMLYDNGQLISLYAHAYQVTHQSLYANVIRQTLDFVKREMSNKEGGFYSSINADSEGEEGKFYVWTMKEINELLQDKTAQLITDYYQLTATGNWEEGKNILYYDVDDETFAQQHHITTAALHQELQKAKTLLFEARAKRIRPSTDDKILTSWNALMLKGYVDAYRALGEEEYLSMALKNASFLEDNMIRKDGSLWRNILKGEPSISGLLDDYALLADAYIELYQVTFDLHWLEKANELTQYAIKHFRDPKSGLFFYTSDEAENLIARKTELEDNVIPASNSVMANVLYRLGIYLSDQTYIDDAKEMLAQVIQQIPTAVPYFSNWALMMGMMQQGPYEIAVMGKNALAKNKKIQLHYLPTSLFMGGKQENLPLLNDKLIEGKTMIYVCENKVCKLPVTETDAALKQINVNHLQP